MHADWLIEFVCDCEAPVCLSVCACVCVCVCVFVSHNLFPRVARSNRAYEHNMAAIVVSAGLCALVSINQQHPSIHLEKLDFFPSSSSFIIMSSVNANPCNSTGTVALRQQPAHAHVHNTTRPKYVRGCLDC